MPLFCSSVVQSLIASSHNQFVVVYGHQSKGKGILFADTLADLLLHLDDPYNRVADITNAVKILRWLCLSVYTDQSTCITMVTLLVDQASNTLRGAHISVSLLDTTQLVNMQVYIYCSTPVVVCCALFGTLN